MDDRTIERGPGVPPVEAFPRPGIRDGDAGGGPVIPDAQNTGEQTAHESERLYRSLFEHMRNGFAHCRMFYEGDQPSDFVYLDVNRAFESQTGLKDVVGRKVSEVIPGIRQSNPELFEVYGRVSRTGKPEVFETYVEPLRMWFAVSVYSLQRDHFVAVFDVITEHKTRSARETLARRVLTALNVGGAGPELIERILHLIQEGTGFEAVAIRLRQGEDYPYHMTSGFPPAFVETQRSLCARDPKGELVRDATGEPVLECLCGDVIRGRFDPSRPYFTKRGSFWTNAASELLAAAAEQGQHLHLRPRTGYESVALVPLRASEGVIGLLHLSDHRFGRLTLELIEFLEDLGDSIGIALARHRALEALRESERQHRELVENANSAIIRWKRDGAITFFNEYAQAFFGYRPEEVLGRHVGILVPERESTGVNLTTLVPSIVDHPERYQDNINENVRRDGRRVWMKWTNKAIYDDQGRVAEILAIGSDLTAAKQAEEEARQAHQALAEQGRREKESVEQQLAQAREELVRKTRLAAIGQVSAGIAHELRNPLGSVRNAVYLLKRRLGPDTPRAKEHIEIIEQEVARADRIIGGLLSLARSERLRKERIDLGQMVREVFGAWPNPAAVRCEMRLDPEPFTVHASRPQLMQAVSNILANALDAMTGTGVFRVEARHEADHDVIVLSDTGPGLDPSIRATLFEPLTTTKATGTGLGLTISKQIIEAHGGTIEAKQEGGRGAEFHIRLPRPPETPGGQQEVP